MAASLSKDNRFRGMFLSVDLFDPVRSRARRVIRLTDLTDTKNALPECIVWVEANDAGTYNNIPLHNITPTPINNTDAWVQLDYADEINYALGFTPDQDLDTIWGSGTFPVPWLQSMETWTSGRPAGSALNGSAILTEKAQKPFTYLWHVAVVTIAMPALLSSNANSTTASQLNKINSDSVTVGGLPYSAKQLLYTGATVGIKKVFQGGGAAKKFPTYYNFLARADTWQKQRATWTGSTWEATTVDMYDKTAFVGKFPAS